METSYFSGYTFIFLKNSPNSRMKNVYLSAYMKKCHGSWHLLTNISDISVHVAPYMYSSHEDLPRLKFVECQWKFDFSKTSVPNSLSI